MINMKIPEGTVSLYLRISPALKARLQDYAARQDVAMNEIVVAAVEEYLEQHDPQAMRPRGK
jgi:predicted HicB family RNase H-like nuclease